MAAEKTPVVAIPLNDDSYSWQIIGLSNPFNETYYVKAAIFDRPFTNGQTTLPVGMISERDAPVTNPYNSSEMTTVDSMTAGTTYVMYGGLLTPSGNWWTTTPISSSVTLPQVSNTNVDFKTATWQMPQNPTNKPFGQNYLEDVSAMNRWGRLGSDGQRHHLWGFYTSDTVDVNELINDTYNALLQNLDPLVRYTVGVIDLNKLLGQGFQPLKVGDSIDIVDRDLGISLTARILEITVDLNTPEKSSIVVGQLREYVSDGLASQPSNPPANFDDFLKHGDPIHSDWLEGKIESLRNQINAGGGTVTITDGDGILITDPNNPALALKLEGGILALSDSLLPNGDYNWRAFGNGAGFTADEINGGTITGVLIQGVTINGANITGGTISAGTTINVGTDLTIGRNIYFGAISAGQSQRLWFDSGAFLDVTSGGRMGLSAYAIDIGNPNFQGTVTFGLNSPSTRITFAAGIPIDFTGAVVTGLPQQTAKFG